MFNTCENTEFMYASQNSILSVGRIQKTLVVFRVEVLIPPPPKKEVWQWGSSSGDLGSVEWPFIIIIPRSTVSRSISYCLGSHSCIK